MPTWRQFLGVNAGWKTVDSSIHGPSTNPSISVQFHEMIGVDLVTLDKVDIRESPCFVDF